MGQELHFGPDRVFYALVMRYGLRTFGYLSRYASDRCKAMKKLIYMLAFALMVSAVSTQFAAARDQNWNSLQHRLVEQQRQQKRWEAVVHSTGAARQEALKQYLYNRPGLWDDQSAP
jgi:hypothetical protein